MQIIKKNNAIKGANSDKCKTLEYSFNDKDIDLGIATITRRYPKLGYCVNTMSCTPAWDEKQHKYRKDMKRCKK